MSVSDLAGLSVKEEGPRRTFGRDNTPILVAALPLTGSSSV